jgi:hypothetical protein
MDSPPFPDMPLLNADLLPPPPSGRHRHGYRHPHVGAAEEEVHTNPMHATIQLITIFLPFSHTFSHQLRLHHTSTHNFSTRLSVLLVDVFV